MDYRAIADKTARLMEGYLRDDSGWKIGKETVLPEESSILIEYKRSPEPEFDGYLYRGSCVIKCPAQTVFEYVDPLPQPQPRLRWDKAMKTIEVLKQLEADLRINRTATHSAALGVISPRDFVDLVLTKKSDDMISTNGVSIECAEFPPVEKYVRGWNYPCGLFCIPVPGEPNHTKLWSIIQPDLRGKLPRAIVDSAIPSSMVDFFVNLESCLKEDGKLV